MIMIIIIIIITIITVYLQHVHLKRNGSSSMKKLELQN